MQKWMVLLMMTVVVLANPFFAQPWRMEGDSYATERTDAGEIRDMMIKVNGIQLHVVDYGGQGEPVVLIHGLTANARYWDAVAERMRDKYHVIALDIRGRGDSAKPATGYYDVWQYAEDIKGMLDHFNIGRAIVMGHSMGAHTAVAFANKYPDRLSRVVLVDGGVGFSEEQSEKINRALQPSLARIGKTYPDFDTYLRLHQQGPYYKQSWNRYVNQYYWHDVRINEDGSVTPKVAKQAVFPEQSRPIDLDALNYKIKVPVLLLQTPDGFILDETSKDTVPVVEPQKGKYLIRLLPQGSRYVEIEGANHYTIVLTKYEEVVKEVKRFLSATAPHGKD
ncbi:alpha/beta fold hydrolase [Laceyella putida]|uniref:Alpha/beta fold hydrolase n=1 Tax=Laceyella putida TaxID=110101 RepID=A0ABW2RLX0_9BACL